MKSTPTLKAIKATKKEDKEYRPKPWLIKPFEEKKVQGYYYVKYKHKDQIKKEIDKLLNQYNDIP